MKTFAENDPRNWFLKKRFGLFVHWGIYAVGAKHEQEEWRYHETQAFYERYAARFNPEKFNPAQWLDLAQEAGMEYIVLTVKHHDGFCLWDTAQTDFSVMNTPYKKDIVKMLADECHRRDFPLEFYYSCVDWHYPAYPNLGRHHEIVTDPSKHDMNAYMAFLKAQIRELCTRYGKIHGIWWDMNVPQLVDSSINQMIRKLQPQAVINNRGYDAGDYSTPERDFVKEGIAAFDHPVEACDSIGMNSWGYRRDEDYFSVRKLERQIALYTSLGGNFLLNAGPKADGAMPAQAVSILRKIGKWYHKTAPALCANPRMEFPFAAEKLTVTVSADGKELFLIFLDPPQGETLILRGIDRMPVDATLMNTGKPVCTTLEPMVYTLEEPTALRLRHLPVNRMNDEIMTIRLRFDKKIKLKRSKDGKILL